MLTRTGVERGKLQEYVDGWTKDTRCSNIQERQKADIIILLQITRSGQCKHPGRCEAETSEHLLVDVILSHSYTNRWHEIKEPVTHFPKSSSSDS
jgi:hypothetical protein